MTQDARSHEPRPDWAALEQDWRSLVEQHGWMVMAVGADGGQPAFQYTVGLTGKGLPEVVVYGLPHATGHALLNDVAGRLVAGRRYADGEQVPELVEGGFRIELWDATWLQDPLAVAYRLYDEDAVRVRQLVLPDRENRMPWEDGFADGYREPLLFTHPSGVGPRPVDPPTDRAARAAGGTSRDRAARCGAAVVGWDLDLPPHTAALVTRWVADGRLPVLAVTRHLDGDWSFVDDVHEVDEDGLSVVCLHHLVEADPTLRDAVRGLGLGMCAYREVVGERWRRGPADDDLAGPF